MAGRSTVRVVDLGQGAGAPHEAVHRTRSVHKGPDDLVGVVDTQRLGVGCRAEVECAQVPPVEQEPVGHLGHGVEPADVAPIVDTGGHYAVGVSPEAVPGRRSRWRSGRGTRARRRHPAPITVDTTTIADAATKAIANSTCPRPVAT